tara:strand:- start:367 stop:1263 length:897 start_codon:yes stop_codon:yes gene_type:complete
MKNIIIAGANGKLGQEIKNFLLNNYGQNVYEVDRNFNFKSLYKKITNYQDLLVDSLIINCAGETVQKHLMKTANYEYPKKLLEIGMKNKISKFIHISSVGSFGAGRYSGKITENSDYMKTKNYYETTKSNFDKFLQKNYADTKICILMPSNIIFRDEKPFLNFIKILKIICPKIYKKDGWLNFIHSDGVCEIVKEIIENNISHKKIILNYPIRYTQAASIIADSSNIRLNFFHIPYFLSLIFFKLFSLLKYFRIPKAGFVLNRIYEMDNDISFISSYEDVNKINKKFGISYIMDNSKI